MAVSLAEAGALRTVTVLGSTGSIGTSTLDLVARNPERFQVVALTANRNVDLLIEQARRFQPCLAVIGDPALFGRLKSGLDGTGIEPAAGPAAVVEAAQRPSDLVMAGIVGAGGLRSTVAAARRGAMVAFANKECLVCAGDIVLEQVRSHGATLLPVDSEHNAIFQVLDLAGRDNLGRLILTASGGPFRTWTASDMAAATPKQAVAHPTWDMGAKISVDSATMMNKGLEVIEAAYLFGVDETQIDIVVHPQSVVHSLVEYADGSVLAQLGSPDMRTPIAYALAWPRRIATPCQRLDLATVATLTFEQPDPQRFPALRLARAALRDGGSAPTTLNAANEVAVAAFLERRIGFLDIAGVVEAVLAQAEHRRLATLEDVEAADAAARRLALQEVARRPI